MCDVTDPLACIISTYMLTGIYLSKALTCMQFFLYKQKLFFIRETDTFGHIVVRTLHTSHIDHFALQHTAFEQSAACVSVFLELLPGLIPFAILTLTASNSKKTNKHAADCSKTVYWGVK